MPNPYPIGDVRRNMHPSVAIGVQSDDLSIALRNGETYIPHTFGGLVTKLVERGAIPFDSRDELHQGVADILAIEPGSISARISDPTLLSAEQADHWAESWATRHRKRERYILESDWRTYLSDAVFAKVKDPEIEHVAQASHRYEREANVALSLCDSARGFSRIAAWGQFAYMYGKFESTSESRYAIRVGDFLDVVRSDTRLASAFSSEEDRVSLYRVISRELEERADVYIMELAYLEVESDVAAILAALKECESELGEAWLTESDVRGIAMEVAGVYMNTDEYYRRDRVTNLLSEILFVSPEQVRLFNDAFPVANGLGALPWLIDKD